MQANQHIFWLDIPMDNIVVMSILEGRSNLFDILHNGGKRNDRSLRMTIAQ